VIFKLDQGEKFSGALAGETRLVFAAQRARASSLNLCTEASSPFPRTMTSPEVR
jgi:hypothetical protein